MEITTNHDLLQQKFSETQRELNELELDTYRINKLLQCSSQRSYANFQNRYEKTNESLFEKEPHFLPAEDLFSKEFSLKQAKEDSFSNSSEKSVSEDEFSIKKVCLQSAVRAVSKTQSKRDVISKQNINKNVRLRNRRILGMLQSTLQKFQDDSEKRKSQDLKRIAVELKVDAAAKEDAKRRMEREKSDLNRKMREKKLILDCLEQMMGITESFHIWKRNMKQSRNSIMTEIEPKIFYLPASHNVITKKKLELSRVETLQNIVRHEKEVVNELALIKESFEAKSFCNEDQIDVAYEDSDFC